MGSSLLAVIVGGVVFLMIILISLFKRYKRCPSDKILVVYGKVGGGTARCIHGGAAFVWPIIQDFAFLDLKPVSIEVNLTNALSKQNIRVDVPSRFTVGVSTEPVIMTNAAERLLGLSMEQTHDLAKDIIFGQLRLVVATMDIEEINSNRDKFLSNVATNVEAELKKIGLRLINVNVTDIKDESGYIEALGKEAAAKAVNDARRRVAEQTRDGSIGEAIAVKEQRVRVSETEAEAKVGEAEAMRTQRIKMSEAEAKAKIGEAEADSQAKIGEAEALRSQRIQVSEADARAVEGENQAKIDIADSESVRRERAAEALRKAVAAEKVGEAKSLEEAYHAQKESEEARAKRDKARQMADVVVPAQISKDKTEIDAEAEAEKIRRHAKGEADAIFFKRQAEAKGLYEILSKQAEGLDQIVKAAGDDPRDAAMLLIADKLPELVKLQTEAIKNIKIDKVTVWDGGNGNGTPEFISGLYKSVPPLQDMFNMAGMQLPDFLKGKDLKKPVEVQETEALNGVDVIDEPKNGSSEN
ncbi:flotillin (plasmid) [Fulvitalea axinellae]|uniref:Flotillin n=1 Tax=Fulvitalea axinellae TaxID=1182444 RepID=A0AAU9D0X3_9BACT|nr:flotillin [Fulvitalea axinellae]